MNSNHYNNDRQRREALIKAIGYGKVVKGFKVDRGHRDGPEMHIITTTGLILIYNWDSHKLITKLIARPAQLTRYKWNCPDYLIAIAKEHQRLGYNNY